MSNTNWLSEFQNAKDSAIYSLDLLRVIAHNLRAVGFNELADSISGEATAAKFFVESMGDCVSEKVQSDYMDAYSSFGNIINSTLEIIDGDGEW